MVWYFVPADIKWSLVKIAGHFLQLDTIRPKAPSGGNWRRTLSRRSFLTSFGWESVAIHSQCSAVTIRTEWINQSQERVECGRFTSTIDMLSGTSAALEFAIQLNSAVASLIIAIIHALTLSTLVLAHSEGRLPVRLLALMRKKLIYQEEFISCLRTITNDQSLTTQQRTPRGLQDLNGMVYAPMNHADVFATHTVFPGNPAAGIHTSYHMTDKIASARCAYLFGAADHNLDAARFKLWSAAWTR